MAKILRSEIDRIEDLDIALYNYKKAYQLFSAHCDKYGTFSHQEKKLSEERHTLWQDWKDKRAKVVAMANQLETLFETELITLP
jgi:uncharacterized protein YhaN